MAQKRYKRNSKKSKTVIADAIDSNKKTTGKKDFSLLFTIITVGAILVFLLSVRLIAKNYSYPKDDKKIRRNYLIFNCRRYRKQGVLLPRRQI